MPRDTMLTLLALIAQAQIVVPSVPPSRPGPAMSAADSTVAIARARATVSSFVRSWRYYWESGENLRWEFTRTFPPPAGVSPLRLSRPDSQAVLRQAQQILAPQPARPILANCNLTPPFDPTGAVSPEIGAKQSGPPPMFATSLDGLGWLGLTFPDTDLPMLAWPTVVGLSQVGTSVPNRNRAGGRLNTAFDVVYEHAVYDPQAAHGFIAWHFGICPSWYPEARTPWDERYSIDSGLLPEAVPIVRAARADLLIALDSLAEMLPGDAWLTGQRVRFALDQGDTSRAARTVIGCTAPRWWCLALNGYLLSSRLDRIAQADAAFEQALAEMPWSVRCEWNDLTDILDENGRAAYSRASCIERDSINTRIWWLADPLYLENGNERRLEHFARRTALILRSGADNDERWDLDPQFGGAAVGSMLMRYGWPSLSLWGGREQEEIRFPALCPPSVVPVDTLCTRPDTVLNRVRSTTAEYSHPRFSTISSWSAIANPFHAASDEWILSREVGRLLYPRDTVWWPQEHLDRRGSPLVQLWHQAGMFRRDSTILLASASNLMAQDFDGAVGDTLRGALFLSTGPASTRWIRQGGIVGRTISVRTHIAPEPQVVGLELAGKRPAGVVARDRYGVTPPPALRSLAPGEIAISEPVLIGPPAANVELPRDTDSLLIRMYGHTVFSQAQRSVSLYWETYGAGEMDTLDLSVRVERVDSNPSLLRRIGMMLGAGARRETGVTVRWRESHRDENTIHVSAGVPIHGRVLTLDLSQLSPGDYALVVTARRSEGPVASAERAFWLIAPPRPLPN